MYDHELNNDQAEQEERSGMTVHKTVDDATGLPTSAGIGSWFRMDLDGERFPEHIRVRMQSLSNGTGRSAIDIEVAPDECQALSEFFGAMAIAKGWEKEMQAGS